MAPNFLESIRRRSKSSHATALSSEVTNGSIRTGLEARALKASGETTSSSIPTTQSSSTTLSSLCGSGTPPRLSINPSALDLNTPQTRPPMSSSTTSRYSVSGMSGLGSQAYAISLPKSPYAPQILSIAENSWVFQKVLSVHGITCARPSETPMDGTITISRIDDSYPSIAWPVCASHFKALLYLEPGLNRFRFDFASPNLNNNNVSNPVHSSLLTLHMLSPTSSPPLKLVILLGKDSPGMFDAVPARTEREGNGIETAIRKFRMAAYLWQAFTGEQMARNKLGRRAFRFDEEWMLGTSNYRDQDWGVMRSEAKVHVVRCERTVAELRDIDLAQQNKNAKKGGQLFSIAADAVRDNFKLQPDQKEHVAVLLLDSHWDPDAALITGHAALGGSVGDLNVAVFGSHALSTYPATFEDVVPAFSDCTGTDPGFIANDCNESGSNWEAANVGIGAHLHEVGHLLGCPHQSSGVMLRDYVTLNRTFTVREAYSTRTKSKRGLVLQKDECNWHRLDVLRFRTHPLFALPHDGARQINDTVRAWPVDNGNLILTASSGVAWLEIYTEGEEVCHTWIEYGDGNGQGPIQRMITITEQDLRSRLPEARRKYKMKVLVFSWHGSKHAIKDFSELNSKHSRVKLPSGQIAFRSSKLGRSAMEDSISEELVLDSAVHLTKLLTKVIVYHGFALDGIDFVYEDATSQLFGKRGGKPGGSEFFLDTRRGESIIGFAVRAGAWIDGLSILTSLGRRSPLYGNPRGGKGHTLIPPRGYNIAGVTGSSTRWIDGFGILITR